MSSILFREIDMAKARDDGLVLAYSMYNLQTALLGVLDDMVRPKIELYRWLFFDPDLPHRIPDAVDHNHLRHYLWQLRREIGCSATITLSFQPDDTFSDINKAVVNYVPSDGVAYEIDLHTLKIYDDSTPSRHWDMPEDGLEAVEELRTYTRNTLRCVKHFRDKLRERGLIDDSSRLRHISLFSCPICSRPLQRCIKCGVPQACSNEDSCAAAAVHDIQSCSIHRRQGSCRECLDDGGRGYTPLVHCPTCGDWRCRVDLSWCLGNLEPIVDDLSDNRLEALRKMQTQGWHSVPRSHAPYPGPCFQYIAHGAERLWFTCANAYNSECPSWSGYLEGLEVQTQICQTCAAAGTLACRCGETKFCKMCSETGYTSELVTCPRCRTVYCTPYCRYIDNCTYCGRTGLCQDCMEEEDIGEWQNEDIERDVGEEKAKEGGDKKGKALEGKATYEPASHHIAWKCNICNMSICRACMADDNVVERCWYNGCRDSPLPLRCRACASASTRPCNGLITRAPEI